MAAGKDVILQKVFREAPLFRALTTEQTARVQRGSRHMHLTENEPLFSAQDPAERFYFVLKGRIKLYHLSLNGAEKVLEIVGPGEHIALAVMFMEHQNYPVSAAGLSESDLLAFDNRIFLAILRESPETCFRMMADMSRRLRGQMSEIRNLSLQSAPVRLTRYLLANKAGCSHPSTPCEAVVRLDASKQVIASRLSIQPETFSRILAKLSSQKLIEVKGRVIHLLDVNALHAFAEEEQKPDKG
ncbi:MAG: Crp/Fnr family transcriptional regulator [Magnetococcales bacterium]|nr:Crp/Fnr family transcriptional regulator [Magnetococcales bacterium]